MAQPPVGTQISDEQAFDLLCGMALSQEQYPGEILGTGVANGWYQRIRKIADSLGWQITIEVKDKQQ